MKPGRNSLTDEERFWHVMSRLNVGDCWLWTGAKAKTYGKTWNGAGYSLVHRYVWEHLVGPLASDLDHLCRVHLCCNPDHLEPVTARQNYRRGAHPNAVRARSNTCKHGHDLNDSWIDRNGTRKCRTCNRERARAMRAKLPPAPPREPSPTCRKGHVYDEVGVYLYRGKRFCMGCRRAADKRRAAV